MSATTARDQVSAVARRDCQQALSQALSIDEPWFACQALAAVLRYGAAPTVAQVSAELSARADLCTDDYQRGAVRAWQVRALAERGLHSEAKAALADAIRVIRRAEPLSSRSEALFLLFQAAFPLGSESVIPLAAMLAEVWRTQPHWRITRSLVSTLAMLTLLTARESQRLLDSTADARIRGRVARKVASGRNVPRSFFW